MCQSDGAKDGGKDLVALVGDHASKYKCVYMLCGCRFSVLILFFVLKKGFD